MGVISELRRYWDVIPDYAILGGLGVLLVVVGLIGWFLWRRRGGPEVHKALEAVAIERLHDVLVP